MSASIMHVAVAICTWNRSKLLDKTLKQMRNLRIPEGVTWELLVVNNNCTDDTDAVLHRHADTLPLRRLLEPKQGLSHSRNCAVAAASGDLMLWTDDDVLVNQDWLAAYVDAARSNPQIVLFGGGITPWFERTPPTWVNKHLGQLDGPFVIRGPVTLEQPLSGANHPFGANMAFRTEVLRKFPFNPALGRTGAGMLGGDDSEIVQRILGAGYRGLWVPEAKVQHFVVAKRLTANYVYQFFRGMHETLATQFSEKSADPFPRWLMRKWLEQTCVCWLRSPWRDDRWMQALLASAKAHGQLSAWWRNRQARPTRNRALACEASAPSLKS